MLKFILIFIAVIYLLGFLGRLLIIYWVKKMAKQAGFYQNAPSNQKEGHVTVDFNQKKSKKFEKNEGDYVDFDEIKD